MIAITTSNSIRVKPDRLLDIERTARLELNNRIGLLASESLRIEMGVPSAQSDGLDFIIEAKFKCETEFALKNLKDFTSARIVAV